jgi:hypothetical protein
MKMRESIYLFKEGFRPIWEDRRNLHGGSWTFRIPKNQGRVVWEQVQMLAIGESFEGALEEGMCNPRRPVGITERHTRLTWLLTRRRPTLRRRPLHSLHLPPDYRLAPRLLQEEVRRRHLTLPPRGPSRRRASPAGQLFLQEALGSRWIQGPAGAAGCA